MQYKVKYDCGHEGYINIIKGQEWKLDSKYLHYCPECYAKVRAEKRRIEAEERANELEKFKLDQDLQLAELQGTEKQVKWAITIREQVIAFYKKQLSLGRLSDLASLGVMDKFKYFLETETSAALYINNLRFVDTGDMYKILKNLQVKTVEEEELEEEIKDESTIVPENFNNKTAYVVEQVGVDRIKVSAGEKNEEIRLYLRSKGFRWEDNAWYKTIETKYYKDNIIDRIAQVANKLLSLGWAVSVIDDIAREKAINGNFSKEYTKFVIKYKENVVKFVWKNQSDKIYKASIKLPKARWTSDEGYGTIVNIAYYKEIIDFSELYNFKITDEVMKMIETYKEKTSEVTVVKKVGTEKTGEEKLQEILSTSNEILEDLKDE